MDPGTPLWISPKDVNADKLRVLVKDLDEGTVYKFKVKAYIIKDGKKAEYIKSFTVAGNFYDMLKNITALSDKVTLPSPFGITTFGSPYVLVENLSIAGK